MLPFRLLLDHGIVQILDLKSVSTSPAIIAGVGLGPLAGARPPVLFRPLLEPTPANKTLAAQGCRQWHPISACGESHPARENSTKLILDESSFYG
jgi:hypothetical protein